ncbi:FAD dependent oxidoreductase [Cristinia sonorae]|uniref:FAD dependent oxidoreductase n=1 Tax=Cristinia sonorae TaxID=1940300 RepID=A0A8K0XL85_9AGAR|nr:FAD dependent oxidoreductase [Cristinia sonorae]
MSHSKVMSLDDKIVIVGAGCFGLSTAYHLLKRGFTSVTVLDKSATLPAPDAASTDLNKVVRSSYSDVFYTRFAREAIAEWKNTSEWGDCYHESGVVVVGNSEATYADKAYENDISLGARIDTLSTPGAVRSAFPSGIKTGSFDNTTGYLNHDGGWASAAAAMSTILRKVTSLGATVLPSKTVTSLIKNNDGKTAGVDCADGSEYNADLVVLAAGSWMASAFPNLGLQHQLTATGQCIAWVELNAEEAAAYKQCPVYLDFVTGFYAFPPNQDNYVKFAIHSAGFTHTPPDGHQVSTPRTVLSDGEDGLRIPREAAKTIRQYLRGLYPDLAEKPFKGTRICWYTDTPDDDWIIGFHPSDSGIMLATAGCGHAFKFLPNIGRLVVDAIQGTMEPAVMQKLSFDRPQPVRDNEFTSGLYRLGQSAKELDLGSLCTAEDLLAQQAES